MKTWELPESCGAYRRYYVDVTDSSYTVAAALSLWQLPCAPAPGRPPASKLYASIHFGLYEKGRRIFGVLSSYEGASLECHGGNLQLGRSHWSYASSGIAIELEENDLRSGLKVEARIELFGGGREGEAVCISEGLSHFIQALWPRVWGRVHLPGLRVAFEGIAYHDLRWGLVLPGKDFACWQWQRTHGERETCIEWFPTLSQGPEPVLGRQLIVDGEGRQRASSSVFPQMRRSLWGLEVPERLRTEGPLCMLESFPFFGRLEARRGGSHSLADVLHFKRSERPLSKWMLWRGLRKVDEF
ncbi:MAG: hypothetical protein FWD46_09475 [Cystobacterineae bacterium]|nr:hypothetical protein [Cystobacterineae bacterium]